jgi:hypothetical protein
VRQVVVHGYRVYILGYGGKITECIEITNCWSDVTAKVRAAQLAHGRRAELWHGNHMIATFEPEQ